MSSGSHLSVRVCWAVGTSYAEMDWSPSVRCGRPVLASECLVCSRGARERRYARACVVAVVGTVVVRVLW